MEMDGMGFGRGPVSHTETSGRKLRELREPTTYMDPRVSPKKIQNLPPKFVP